MKTAIVGIVCIGLGLVPAIGHAQQVDVAAAEKQFGKYCARCHGAEGRGDGEQGATLQQRPRDFTDCAAMAETSDDVLFDVIKNGGAPVQGQKSDMPAMRRSFSDDEIHALLARVRRFCAPGGAVSNARARASTASE